MKVKTETSVKVISIILIVFYGMGALGKSLSLILLHTESFRPIFAQVLANTNYNYLLAMGIAYIVINFLIVAGSIGILKKKEWGRKLTTRTLIVGIILQVASFVYSSFTNPATITTYTIFAFVISLGIYGSITYFLTRKKTKKVFS